MSNTPSLHTGRRVLFVGGPEAGNVRSVPNSHGDTVKSKEGDWVYQIHAFQAGNSYLYVAYENGNHILNAIVDMFREYAPAAQIKRESGIQTYTSVKPAP